MTKKLCLPGGGMATVKINLPIKWDELMAQRGYKPIKSFYLFPVSSGRIP